MNRSRLKKPPEVAERLALHPATVRRLAASGALPSIRIGRRAVRFTDEDVETFLRQRRQDPAPAA